MKMKPRHVITAEQKAEIEAARKANKNKRVETRLKALSLRAEGMSYQDISGIVGMNPDYLQILVAKYCKEGLESIVESKYGGNRRNMSYAEEEALLEPFKKEAEAGHIITTAEIKAKYVEAVGHSIGNGQIYCVLKRHGWRKVMPRSRHPKKASDEAIEASKKLKQESGN